MSVVREALAEQFHDAWVDWSKTLADEEDLSEERLERWREFWVPYGELSEDVKDYDRKYADEAVDRLMYPLLTGEL